MTRFRVSDGAASSDPLVSRWVELRDCDRVEAVLLDDDDPELGERWGVAIVTPAGEQQFVFRALSASGAERAARLIALHRGRR